MGLTPQAGLEALLAAMKAEILAAMREEINQAKKEILKGMSCAMRDAN